MRSISEEREMLSPLQDLADITIDTSKLNVHELRNLIFQQFRTSDDEGKILIQVNSFGFRHGVPADSDLVFDVRFLPNPNYIPEFKKLSGRHASVARYIRSFPQIDRIHQSNFRSAGLSHPALHPRRQKLSHHLVRLHGRQTPLSDDRARNTSPFGKGRIHGERVAPRR